MYIHSHGANMEAHKCHHKKLVILRVLGGSVLVLGPGLGVQGLWSLVSRVSDFYCVTREPCDQNCTAVFRMVYLLLPSSSYEPRITPYDHILPCYVMVPCWKYSFPGGVVGALQGSSRG